MDTHRLADVSADGVAADRYRLAQRAELEVRFGEAMEHGASDQAKLLAWIAGARVEWCGAAGVAAGAASRLNEKE